MIHIHIHVLMNCLECGALHNFWPSACSDRDGNQAFLSSILNTVDELVGNCYLAISFEASDQVIWFHFVAFGGFWWFCMKWLWLAITILCMSVHVSILSWSKLDLAAAAKHELRLSDHLSFKEQKGHHVEGRERDLPIWNRPLPNVPLFTIPLALL